MLKHYFSGLLTIAMAACAGIGISSCSPANENLYNKEIVEEIQKGNYAENFIKKYGTIAPNQSWDFSTGKVSYRATRAAEDYTPTVVDDWYYVEPASIEYMENTLEEGKNNRNLGHPFIMNVPVNGFGIVPIYQGAAAWTWNLHMVIMLGGEELADVTVWEKHRDLECQLTDEQIEFDHYPSHKLSELDDSQMNFANMFENGGGKNEDKQKFQAAFPNGKGLDTDHFRSGNEWYTTKQAFGLHDSVVEGLGGADWAPKEPGLNGWWENYEVGWNTTLAKAIRTKFINFGKLPEGASVYFYLDVWDGQTYKGRKSSLGHMMVALDRMERPTNIDQKNEVIMIGCEDNDANDSDWDMNDLVFMVVGYPGLPETIKLDENNQYQYEEKTSKRYMVEDLGSTDDFDFNDIVVDVEEVATHTVTFNEQGEKTSDEKTGTTQRAIIRAMGGTLDFTLHIGNTIWTKSNKFNVSQMYNTQGPNFGEKLHEFEVEGWNPSTNNIKVTVNNTSEGVGTKSIDFPEAGDVPMIIATDTNINWQSERNSMPKSWLTEGPSNN